MRDGFSFVLLIAGAGLLVALPFAGWFFHLGRRNRALASASRNWPTVPGRVLVSRIDEISRWAGRAGRARGYRPVVRYEYAVAGIRREGDVIQFGAYEFNSRVQAESFVKDRPVGASVAVYFDPDEPAVATLDTSSYSADWQVRAAWIILIALPAILLLAGLIAISAA